MIGLVDGKRLLKHLSLFIDALFCLFVSRLLFHRPVASSLLPPSRIYQFSKKHALEECRQQVALSQGIRAKLEVQRVLLKEKLEWLGCREPPSAQKLNPDAVSLSSITAGVSQD